MSKLLPWLKLKTVMAPVNIEVLVDLENIPEKPGVYIMLSDNVEYPYPWSEYKGHGKSQVYYIGQTQNLRRRLADHQQGCKKVVETLKKEPDTDLGYYPRYEYAGWHGCNVVWLVSRTPKVKETELMEKFRHYYGAKPVANG
jgi:hypothetical protein